MKRILSVLLALVLVCACFAACTGEKTVSSEATESDNVVSAATTHGEVYKIGI